MIGDAGKRGGGHRGPAVVQPLQVVCVHVREEEERDPCTAVRTSAVRTVGRKRARASTSAAPLARRRRAHVHSRGRERGGRPRRAMLRAVPGRGTK